MKFDEKKLRSCGFKEVAPGQWGKEGSAPENSTGRPHVERDAERPLANDPQVEEHPIQRYLAIVTVVTVRPRDFDGLGASAKYHIDAIRHLGIIEDDSPEHIEVVCVSQSCNHFDNEETIIEIWEIPESPL